jgi:hypothetical protein
MKRSVGLTALVLVLLLTACTQEMPEATLLTLESLPNREGPRVEQITGNSAVVLFSSDTPTVCNVTYGTDTTYGTIATDMMMSGATQDHDITLTGLKPDTTYHYRINLIDQQGRHYQSQDLTFTTMTENTAQPSVEGDEDLATLEHGARVIDVSSNFGGGDDNSSFGANKAIDGEPDTAWSSNGDGDDAWIEIALDDTYDIHTLGFWTRTMSDNTAQIQAFTVTTDQEETFGPFELPNATEIHTFELEFTARTLRFDAVETNGGNTGAVEIVVYGNHHTP